MNLSGTIELHNAGAFAETITIGLDYSQTDEVRNGQLLTGTPHIELLNPPDSALVLGSPSIPASGPGAGKWVTWTVVPGTPGTNYVILCQVQFTGGNTTVEGLEVSIPAAGI